MPNDRTLLAAYDRELRGDAEFSGMRREIHDGLVTHTSLLGGTGCIPGGDGCHLDRIAGEIEYFEAIGQDVDWLVCDHDAGAEALSRSLMDRGFRRSHGRTVLIRDATDDAPAIPSGLEVCPVLDSESAALAASVQERVRGRELPMLGVQLQEQISHHPKSLGAFLVVCDRVPAGSGWVTFAGGSRFGSLVGGGVLPAHAGRGVYRALLEVRVREAAGRGATHLVAEVEPRVSEGMKRHGFRPLTRMTRFRYSVARPI